MPWAVMAGVFGAVASGLMSTWASSTSLAAIFGYQVINGGRGLGVQVVSCFNTHD